MLWPNTRRIEGRNTPERPYGCLASAPLRSHNKDRICDVRCYVREPTKGMKEEREVGVLLSPPIRALHHAASFSGNIACSRFLAFALPFSAARRSHFSASAGSGAVPLPTA